MHQPTPTDKLHSLLLNLPLQKDKKYQQHFGQIKRVIAEGADVNEWRLNGTPLQKILGKNKINLNVLRFLLEKGAKSYIPDEKYQLPMQVVGSQSKKQSIIELFKWRSVVEEGHLNQVIEFCLEFYIGEKNSYREDNLLLDFATSLLTGQDINPLLTKKETWLKYIAHLREIKQASLGEEIKFKLEGWQQTIFLATRVRALLEIVIELEFSEVSSSGMSLPETSKLLKKEILLEIESLHISQAIGIIKNFPPADQQELAESLAHSISKAMPIFLKEPHDEYCLPSGWATHALYISFVLLDNSEVMVRGDNLGSRPPKCHLEESKKFYPVLLGKTQMDELKNGKQKKYITNLIMTKIAPYPPKTAPKGRRTKRQQFFQTIYFDASKELKLSALPKDQKCILPILQQLKYTPRFSQKAGTCVVTNHNVGLRIRFKTESFYQWVLEQEMARLGKIAYDSSTDISGWWPKFRQPRQLSRRIVHDCKQHCQRQSKMTFLFAESRLHDESSIEFVVPDLLEKEFKENKWQTNTISATTLYEKYLEPNLSIFVQGRAGMGKSTLCRYIASRWSAYRLWRDKFTLVLYISLRNLNPNRYPPQQTYQLLDVVKKECFSLKRIPAFEENHLAKILASEHVLWLLDGYDELPVLSDSLKAIILEISKKSRLIVTSRYPLPSHLMPKIYLETAGFNDESIDKYIKNFYKELPDESEKLQKFLNDHKIIKKNAAIPINLEIICSIWQSNRAELQETKILTTTHLYRTITLWLLRRFLLRDNEFLTQPTRLVESSKLRNDHRVLRRLTLEMQMLERISFDMMQKLLYQLPGKDFDSLTPPVIPDSSEFKDDVIDIGILVPSGGIKQKIADFKNAVEEKEGKVEIKEVKETKSEMKEKEEKVQAAEDKGTREYEFIHASFQEFFAARHLIAGLYCRAGTPAHEQAIHFITTRRYNSLAVMEFAAGLLAGNTVEDKEARQGFWRALQQPPYDLTHLNQVNLLISCLQQTLASNPILDVDEGIINYINQTLLSLFQHKDEAVVEDFNFEKLLQTLSTSHQIISQFCRTYFITLAYVDDQSFTTVAANLIREADIALQLLVLETAQQLLFQYSDKKVDLYIIRTIKAHSATAKQICDFLLTATRNPDSPNQARAIRLLGDFGFKNTEVTKALKTGLSSSIRSVRLNSIYSLDQLLIYDDEIFEQLTQIVKDDKSKTLRIEADKVISNLEAYQAHCEEPNGYDFPEIGDDYDDCPYEQKAEEAKADDERTYVRRSKIPYLFISSHQKPIERWVTEGYYTQKYSLNDREKKLGKQELETRATENKQSGEKYTLSVEDPEGKIIEMKVNERVYKEYQWLQQGESNLSLDLILKIGELMLKFLIEKKLYLPNTEFRAILDAYIFTVKKNNNNLLADLMIKHALKKDITIVVTKEKFFIYKEQNEKEIELPATPSLIISFIKQFNNLGKRLGLQPMPALFDSPYPFELQTLFSKYERLHDAKEEKEGTYKLIYQELSGIYPDDKPTAQEALVKRLNELEGISELTGAQKLEKIILEKIKPKIKASAEEKQSPPPDPPMDHCDVAVSQNKAMESASSDSLYMVDQPSKKSKIEISQSGHSFLVATKILSHQSCELDISKFTSG